MKQVIFGKDGTEYLCVESKKVQELHKRFLKYKTEESLKGDTDFYDGELNALNLLFGDKCLPDKVSATQEELNNATPDKSVTEIAKEITERCIKPVEEHFAKEQPSVQGEPKYKYNIGDLVTYRGKVKKVINRELDWSGAIMYTCSLLNGQSALRFEEESLEPYTEPETKDMEEKELNLCELLKGCEGEEFYSIVYGNVILEVIHTPEVDDPKYYLLIRPDSYSIGREIVYSNGKANVKGAVILYPSRALYEKYPLDAYSAWMEWKESRKPKRWIPKNGEGFWCISPSLKSHYYAESDPFFDWESDLNHFRTKEEAQQAVEVVREALAKFYEQNAEK